MRENKEETKVDIEIIEKGIIVMVDPNGIAMICRVSHIILTEGDSVRISAKIVPIGTAEISSAFLLDHKS